jgi:antirestriction protein
MTVEYSQDDLCDHIAEGKSLVSWCKKTGIGYSTIMAHLAADEQFQEKYTRAREAQADYLVDEIIEIADEAPTEAIVDEQVVKYDATAVARNRLRVDTRKWAASKMKPKKYGEAQLMKIADAEGNKLPVTVTHAIPFSPNGDKSPV